MKTTHIFSIGITAFILSACGSSGDKETTYHASVSINNLEQSGLELQLKATESSESMFIDGKQEVSFDSRYPSGEQIQLLVAQQPNGQVCEVEDNTQIIDSSDIQFNLSCTNIEYNVRASFTDAIPVGRQFAYSGTYNGSVEIESSAEFTLAQTFHYDDSLTLELDELYGYQCSQTASTFPVIVQSDSVIEIDCQSVGSLSGAISEYLTGNPVSEAIVTVLRKIDEEWVEIGTTQSDSNGLYEVNAIGIAEQFVLKVETPDYVNNSIILGNTSEELDIVSSQLLYEADQANTFALDEAVNLSDGNVNLVEIPAEGLQTQSGADPVGLIEASVTQIDPSSDPQLMPGNYQALGENGESQLIESYGAINVALTDANGDRLNLKSGETAKIKIPVAAIAANPPAEIPLYFFDENSGLWQQEGSAQFVIHDGQSYYEGEVSHFTTWNADRAYEQVFVSGCVVDVDGNSISYARIFAQGQDYIGRSSTVSDENGQFILPVRPDSEMLITAQKSSQGNTVSLSSDNSDQTMEECLVIGRNSATVTLTWGSNPWDLDTHFWGPTEEGLNERFHIYFANKQETVADVEFDLDVDDTSSYGPEVLTVVDFPLPGRYRYAVHHYSGIGSIFNSPARVELNLAGQIRVFRPEQEVDSSSSSNRYWVVFDLIVDEDKQVTIMPINLHTNSLSVNTVGVEELQARPLRASQMLPLQAKF